ncbi:Arc family DNA-binding protein [Paracidovorax wautersii]|uniref:Arc-like DNA binding domain-containing protein n=1 Tax=Paracidovorax wautersii TaxID=1177982 RepID=A0ABU1IG22_9BURK|nr:Arc family DNA-binding protein [Paracidovorax wautersii]MDR6216161.1 hypothetical protein [Paracidovorax wautersii]
MVHATNVPFRSIVVNTYLVHHPHPMKQTDPQYKLRIPPDLKEQIEIAAKASGRSMNAEIVARLLSTFTAERAFVSTQEPWEVAAAKARSALDPLEDQFQRARAELEAASPNAMAKRMIEEMRAQEQADLKKLIADAMGPTIEDQIHRAMEDQRKWLEEMANVGIVNRAMKSKPAKK